MNNLDRLKDIDMRLYRITVDLEVADETPDN